MQIFKITLESEDHFKILAQKSVLKIHAAFMNTKVLFPIHAILYA